MAQRRAHIAEFPAGASQRGGGRKGETVVGAPVGATPPGHAPSSRDCRPRLQARLGAPKSAESTIYRWLRQSPANYRGSMAGKPAILQCRCRACGQALGRESVCSLTPGAFSPSPSLCLSLFLSVLVCGECSLHSPRCLCFVSSVAASQSASTDSTAIGFSLFLSFSFRSHGGQSLHSSRSVRTSVSRALSRFL